MRRKIALLLAGLALIGLLVWSFGRSSVAERIASQSVRPEQQRLWREVASKNLAPGLDRVPMPGSPIQNPPAPLPPSQPAPPGSSVLPRGATTAIQLVRATPAGSWSYSGKATVKDIANERIDLNVTNRAVTFLAKLGGQPLPVMVNQSIDLEYRSESGSNSAEHILAVVVDRATAVAGILKSGTARVSVQIQLLNLTLEQMGAQQNGAMPVIATVITPGDAKGPATKAAETIQPGTITPVQVGDVFIRLEGSLAPPAGAPRTDGNPYAIDAVAWRSATARQ